MRVVIFTETFLPKVDGIVHVICLLLDHLTESGIETMVVSPRMGDITYYNQTRVVTVPGITLPLYPELKIGPPRPSTFRAVKEFQPDIIHVFHPIMLGIPGMLMAKRSGIPVLASFHLDYAQLAKYFHLGFLRPAIDIATRLIFNYADYSLAPSRLIQEKMLNLGIRDVGLWRRGVDAERFHPRYASDAMRDQLTDGHPDDTLLLYVGRLSHEKNIPHIRAALEQVPNTRLAIIGDGPARESIEREFAGTKTKFMGYMTGEPLLQAYASADIFVFPSSMETFGLVVVEAMAAGLPVVAARVGGVMDVITEGVNGYSFDVGDVPALVEGIRQIASDRDTMYQMGRNARAFAETQTWPAMMDEVIAHYQRLITA